MEEHDNALLRGTVTQFIGQIDAGNLAAESKLCELIYDELRAIGRRIRCRSAVCSMSPTDVVNDFLGRVLADGRLGQMTNRRYFYLAAANQMRRLLIDRWRQKRAQIRGGNRQREDLEPWLDQLVDSAASRCGGDLEALEAALAQLGQERPRQYEIVQLKVFAGLTNEQAEAFNVSVDTVKHDWQRGRARLGRA